jgi:hypothetical protein
VIILASFIVFLNPVSSAAPPVHGDNITGVISEVKNHDNSAAFESDRKPKPGYAPMFRQRGFGGSVDARSDEAVGDSNTYKNVVIYIVGNNIGKDGSKRKILSQNDQTEDTVYTAPDHPFFGGNWVGEKKPTGTPMRSEYPVINENRPSVEAENENNKEVVVPGCDYSPKKGKVIMVKGDSLIIRLDDRVKAIKGEIAKLSSRSPDGSLKFIGKWEVSKVKDDDTFEALPIQIFGKPKVGMEVDVWCPEAE